MARPVLALALIAMVGGCALIRVPARLVSGTGSAAIKSVTPDAEDV